MEEPPNWLAYLKGAKKEHTFYLCEEAPDTTSTQTTTTITSTTTTWTTTTTRTTTTTVTTTSTTVTTSTSTTTTITSTTTTTTITSTTTTTTTTIYDVRNVDCVEHQDPCSPACERAEERNYVVYVNVSRLGKVCKGPQDCVPGVDYCPTTTTTTTATTSTTLTTTTITTTTITTTTTTVFDDQNVDCQEKQDECNELCQKASERNYQMMVAAVKRGRACRGPTDCKVGDDLCYKLEVETQSTTTTTATSTTSTAFPYVIMAAGKCNSSEAWLTTQEDCEQAAAVLELFSTSAIVAGSSNNPYGCYYKQSSDTLYWNLRGNKKDDDTDRVSICNTVQVRPAPALGGGPGASAGVDLGTQSNATNASEPAGGDVVGVSSVAKQADMLFGAMDADKDGYIGISELVKFCEDKECSADALLAEIGETKPDRATFVLAFMEKRVKSMDLAKLVATIKADAPDTLNPPEGSAGDSANTTTGDGAGGASTGVAEAAGGGGGGSSIGPIVGGVVGGVFLLVCVAAYLHNRRKPKEQMVQSFSARLGTAQTFSNPAYENANQRDGELEGVLGGLAAATDDGELYDVQDGVEGAGEENYEDPDQATYEDPDAPAAKTAAKTKTAGHLAPSAVGGDQPNYEDIDEAQGNYEVIPTVQQVPGAAADDGQPNYEDLDANIAPGGTMNDQNYRNVSTAVGGENYGTLDAVAARAGGSVSYCKVPCVSVFFWQEDSSVWAFGAALPRCAGRVGFAAADFLGGVFFTRIRYESPAGPRRMTTPTALVKRTWTTRELR